MAPQQASVSLSPSQPTVTVVVPNYNHAHFLPQSLESIAAQTHSPDRVLIIDDASTDDSIAVISQFLSVHPNWSLIQHTVRQGVVFGQNEGVSATDTDWITFLGADDALHPDYLSKSLQQAAHSPTAGLICSCYEVIGASEDRILRPMMLPKVSPGPASPSEFRSMLLAGDNYFSGTVTLYRRNAIRARGGFDQALGAFADAFLARQLAGQFGFSFIPEILGYWRLHGQNYSVVTSTNPQTISEKLERIRKIINAERDLFPAHYDDIFERRTRFASARLVVMAKAVSRTVQARQVAALLNARKLEHLWLRLLLSFGFPGQIGALSWLTLRLRPMSIWKLVRQMRKRRSILTGSTPYSP